MDRITLDITTGRRCLRIILGSFFDVGARNAQFKSSLSALPPYYRNKTQSFASSRKTRTSSVYHLAKPQQKELKGSAESMAEQMQSS